MIAVVYGTGRLNLSRETNNYQARINSPCSTDHNNKVTLRLMPSLLNVIESSGILYGGLHEVVVRPT